MQWFYCCCCCWCRLTAGKAEAGLAAADVLAAWWWLEEKRCVVAGRVVKTAAVCRSVDSATLTVDSQGTRESRYVVLTFFTCAEATDDGLKCFVGVSVKISGLAGLGCWSSTTSKEVGCPLSCFCPLVATWLC